MKCVYAATKKWDTAAPEAIMKCLDGFITDFSGARLTYPQKKENTENGNGVLVTKSKALHEEIIKKIAEFKL